MNFKLSKAKNIIRVCEVQNKVAKTLLEKSQKAKRNKQNKLKIMYSVKNLIENNNSKKVEKPELKKGLEIKDFIKKILQKHPTLTNSEIKLSMFIKLGMKPKEIATVLYKTSDSINFARYLLHQKLELPSEQNLSTYIVSF